MKFPPQSIPFILVVLIVFSNCKPAIKESHVAITEEEEITKIPKNAIWTSIDSLNSVVTWIGSKTSTQHNGIIPIGSGKIAHSQYEIFGGEFNLKISDLKVMDLHDAPDRREKLRSHLVGEDFFETDSFPSAHFEITEILPYDSTLLPNDQQEFHSDFKPAALSAFMVKTPTHWLSGNLTIKGITNNISFPVRVSWLRNMVQAEAKFNIDRTDWNISYNNEASILDKAKDKFIYNTVNVGVYLEAKLP